MYKYYSILRPVSIGTYPKEGMQKFVNFDKRLEIPGIGMAWGFLVYSRKLSDKECFSYDLKPENITHRKKEIE